MLKTDHVKKFKRDGFLIVNDAVDSTTLRQLQETTDEFIERSRGVTESDGIFELEPTHNATHPRLHRLQHPVTQSDVYWQAATSNAVLDCVEALIGPNIKFHHSKLNMKAKMGGAEIGWHQDFAFFPHTNFDLIACGIALDDSTLENGCLMVVPGSHDKLFSHRDKAWQFQGKIIDPEEEINTAGAVAVEMQAGDMSIHHACTVHGSSQNTSNDPRRLLIFQYAACDAIVLDHHPLANEFSERVIRGQPAKHARLAGAIHLPLRGDTGKSRSIFQSQRTRD